MREPGGGDDAGGEALVRSHFEQGWQWRLQRGLAVIVGHAGGLADVPDAGLVARHDGRHGAGAVRDLGVGVVGLDEGQVREVFEGQRVLFAGLPLLLPGENARRRDGADAHAVPEEQDHVALAHRFPGAVNLFRGCAGGQGDRRQDKDA